VLGFGAGDAWWCPFCRLKHYCSVCVVCDIKLVFNSSTITMMHGPINIRNIRCMFRLNFAVTVPNKKYNSLKQHFIEVIKKAFRSA